MKKKISAGLAAGAIAVGLMMASPLAAQAAGTVYAWSYQGTNASGAYVYGNHLGGTMTVSDYVGDSFYGSEDDLAREVSTQR